MKKIYQKLRILILSVMCLSSVTLLAQNAWINEIHYDNGGADVGEFIEVVIENAGSYTLSDFQVDLYNGSSSSGAVYFTTTLDQFVPGVVSGNFSFFYELISGIQNGSPDGMALSYQQTLIPGQFLSYEGTFTGVGGPADGVLSTDIGVSEAGTEPAGLSLQLSGSGTTYAEFIWEGPIAETPGDINVNQSFGGSILPEPSNYPIDFNVSADGLLVTVTWTDATGSQLPSAYLIKASDQNNIVAPVDGVAEVNDADLSDGIGQLNVSYGTQTCTFYRLNGETDYYFQIYPYTNSGSNIDYKTDGTAPSAMVTTVAEINTNDFETGDFGSWTAISVASDKDWAVVNYGGAFGTTYFAQMNGYGESEPSNDWLISPSLNLNNYANDMMVFQTAWKYGSDDTELKVFYSTDYSDGDPTLANWTELSFNKASVADSWVSSGDIDLSGINSSDVHIAFQYLSDGGQRRWSLDEIQITGTTIVSLINVTSPVAGVYWEQGTAHDITWTISNTQPNVKIELSSNASSGNPIWSVLAASVPANQGSWTWNIPTNQTISDDCQIRITDFVSDAEGLSGIFSVVAPIYIPQIVITEIMYNPPESGTDSLEFIELYNNDNITVNLDGYYFSDGVTFTFPDVDVNPGDYILVAYDSLAMLNTFGVTAYSYTGGLSNSGELILLRNSFGMVVDSVMYDDTDPWPTQPDGNGPSLRFCDPSLDNADAANWSVSIEFAAINTDGDTIYASPGAGCADWPTADFEADNTIITPGSTVSFTDLSSGGPDEWIWTFPGGNPGSFVGQVPPAIMYNNAGDYNVALHVSNAAGTSTEEKSNYIHVGLAPEADFTANTTTIYEGETIDFSDLSTNSPDSWEWTFDGGVPGTANVQNPASIQYNAFGTYDVTLTVSNVFGNNTMTKEAYIQVDPVGIEEVAKGGVAVYPNPSNGQFNLTSGMDENLVLKIHSAIGQLVYTNSISKGTTNIDLNQQGKGFYILSLQDKSGKTIMMEKLMIK